MSHYPKVCAGAGLLLRLKHIRIEIIRRRCRVHRQSERVEPEAARRLSPFRFPTAFLHEHGGRAKCCHWSALRSGENSGPTGEPKSQRGDEPSDSQRLWRIASPKTS